MNEIRTTRQPLPVPEPDLTPDEMIARAVALRPLLRADQDAGDERGHYSEALHREFLKAGFYRCLQPRLFGGYEFDYPTYFKMIVEISRGHPGAGWCLCLVSSHGAVVASHWPEQAQVELFGPDGDFRASHRAGPAGTLARVEGGYLVDGTWTYSSGVPWATHALLNSRLPTPDGPKTGIAVLPRAKFEILDDWGGDVTLGMQASGSNSVRVTSQFVPEHHVVFLPPGNFANAEMTDGTPGTRLHGNPFYLGRVVSPYQASLAAVVIGAARAALDEFEEIITTRDTLQPPFMKRYQHFDFQRAYGQGLLLTDTAETAMLGAMRDYMAYCRRWARDGTPIGTEENIRLLGVCITAGNMACEAVEVLFRNAGATANKRGQRMQRYVRDVLMYRGHSSPQELNVASGLARIHFGVTPVGMYGL